MSSVLVIGAGGVLGRVIARAFEIEGWEVWHAARRPTKAERFRQIDVKRPDSVGEAIVGVDLAVNAVLDTGGTAERVVLDRGGLLLNVAGPLLATRLSLRAYDRGQTRGLVVLNAGLFPGLTNLVAAALVRDHPQADTVEIVHSFSAAGTSGRTAREWLHSYLTARRHLPTFRVALPRPHGMRRCLRIADEERGWLEASAGSRQVRCGAWFLERGNDRFVRTLNALRLISLLPRSLFAAPPHFLSPAAHFDPAAEPTRDPITGWVAVYRDGERLAAKTIEAEGDYLTTARATLSMGEALLIGHRSQRGVHSVEELITLSDLDSALKSRDICIVDRFD